MNQLKTAANWAVKNPKAAASGALVGAGLTAVAAPMVMAGPLLGMAGFGSTGVVGGSIAAAAQGMIGNVAAGSVFATLTSAGMGGYGVAAVAGVAQGAGGAAVATGAAGVWKAWKERNNTDQERAGDGSEGVYGDGREAKAVQVGLAGEKSEEEEESESDEEVHEGDGEGEASEDDRRVVEEVGKN